MAEHQTQVASSVQRIADRIHLQICSELPPRDAPLQKTVGGQTSGHDVALEEAIASRRVHLRLDDDPREKSARGPPQCLGEQAKMALQILAWRLRFRNG